MGFEGYDDATDYGAQTEVVDNSNNWEFEGYGRRDGVVADQTEDEDGDYEDDILAVEVSDRAVENAEGIDADSDPETASDELNTDGLEALPSRTDAEAFLARYYASREGGDASRIGGARTGDRQQPPEGLRPSDQHTYNMPADTHGLSPTEIDAKYREDAARSRAGQEFEGGRQPNQQEIDALGRFGESMIRIGDEIGVDLRGRLTDPRHIHIFRDANLYRAAVSQVAPGNEMSRGTVAPHAGILVVEKVNPLDNVYGVMHEETHDLSHHIITPNIEVVADGSVAVNAAKSDVKVGYMPLCRPGKHVTNESITDMATHRGMVNAGFPRIMPGYAVGSLLMSGIVEDTAERLGIHPQEVENQLTKGMVSPDMTGIDMVRQALGEQGVTALLNSPAYLRTADAANLATYQIGSPAAGRALWGREVGAPTDWFTWR